jgi:hypothetical protein
MNEKKGWGPEKKTKASYIIAVLTVLFAIFVGVLVANFSNDALPIILGTGALIYGPACLIAYLIEVRQGVFRESDEAEEDSD